jgi:hypothetical protein
MKMSNEFDQKAFDKLKEKVYNVNMEKWNYYKLFEKLDLEYRKLQNELEKMCQHEWEIDRDSFDPCRTCLVCKKCGSER